VLLLFVPSSAAVAAAAAVQVGGGPRLPLPLQKNTEISNYDECKGPKFTVT